MTRNTATVLGFGAIVLWALLALLTELSGVIPPFQMAAMTLAVGGAAGLAVMVLRRRSFRAFRQPWKVWALGVGGLFGYHFLYFTALRAAPAAEASLIAFLWPLLIVLFSTLATGERLKPSHVIGAVLGLVGAALLIASEGGLAPDPEFAFGYAVAFAAAFVWSGYSVLSRRVASVPTDAVTAFCLVTAAFAAIAHLAVEETHWPNEPVAWAAVLGLGLGPVGLAFFLWDFGMKRGDVAFLGAASYAAPLLSTIILVASGRALFSTNLAIGCVLITLGASVAASSYLRKGDRIAKRLR